MTYQDNSRAPVKTTSRGLNAIMEAPEFIRSIATRIGGDEAYAKKFVKMFQTAINKNELLLKCTPESVRIAAGQLAELNLSPVMAYGQAYLIPYKDQCQLQLGWRGLTHIAQRDGGVRSIHSEIVYKGDTFICSQGLEPKLIHDLNFDCQRDEKNIYAVYAVAVLSDGTKLFEVMSKSQIDEIKNTYSQPVKNGKSTPWTTIAYGEMARKTVVKRLCKYLPVDTSLADAIEIDNKAAGYEEKDITDHAEIVEDLSTRIKAKKSASANKPFDVSNMDVEEAVYEVPPSFIPSNNEPEKEEKIAEPYSTGDYQMDVLRASEDAVDQGIMSQKAVDAYCSTYKVYTPSNLPKEAALALIDDIKIKFNKLYGGPNANTD